MLGGWRWTITAGLMGLALASSAGCPGELKNPERFLAGSGGCPDIETNLFPNKCGESTCHNADDLAGELDLVSAGVADRVVGQTGTSACMGAVIADPSNPEQSLLITKLERMPPCGAPMPFARDPLSDLERQCLVDWIAAQMPGPASATGTGGAAGMGGMGGTGGAAGMGGDGGAGGS